MTVDVTDECSSIDSVIINLSVIGRLSAQPMYDDGTNGDVVSGDGIYSWMTTVAAVTDEGRYDLSVTATDVAGNVRSDVPILLYVDNTPPVVSNPNAEPSTVPHDGDYTSLLTVNATDEPFGAEGIESVTINLSEIGGSEIQPMYDDGTYGDEQSGDGVYSYKVTITSGTENDTYQLPVTVVDIAEQTATDVVELTVDIGPPTAEIA